MLICAPVDAQYTKRTSARVTRKGNIELNLINFTQVHIYYDIHWYRIYHTTSQESVPTM
jgi:hypothetical protein